MLNYDEFGEVDGCTHRIPSLDMDRAEAADLERVAHDAVRSLHAYVVHLDELAKLDRVRVVELEAALALAEQRVRIAYSFINWVVEQSEGGGGIPPQDLVRRGTRALIGQERTPSRAPRPPH